MRDRPLELSTDLRLRPRLTRRLLLQGAAGFLAFEAMSPRLAWALPVTGAAACPSGFTGSYPPPLQRLIAKLDPREDVFAGEVDAAELDVLLLRWSESLCADAKDEAVLEALLAGTLDACELVPVQTAVLRAEGPVRTERCSFAKPRGMTRAAFLKSWTSYVLPFTRLETFDLAIYGMRRSDGVPLRVEVDLVYGIVGTTAGGLREQRGGTWTLTWQRSPAGQWTVTGWTAHEETRSHLTGPGFRDVTAQAFDMTTPALRQLARGQDEWRGRLDAACGLDVYGNCGVAAGDIDGNGSDSLYVCQPSGLPNRLLRNRGDGTFEDITDRSGTGLLDGTASALFVDWQNRGVQDLLVVRSGGPLLFHNLGGGRFEARPDAFKFKTPPQGTFTSVTAADYNRDGLVDVYLCVYSYYQGLNRYQFPSPYYDAQNGPPNYLFRNRGDGTFEDVTAASGLMTNNNRFSFAAEWCDYDQDGWPDLHVANDFGRKNLYRNNRDGTFTDVAAASGVEDYGPGMSTCWMDYDNDGRQDLYVANMWLAEGRRITADARFLPDATPAVRALYQKHNAGNSLFQNSAHGFQDRTQTAGTARGGWSWSCSSWDFDHDGFADLYVTNGFVTGAKNLDLQSFFWRQVAQRSADPAGTATDYETAWNAINELVRSDYSWSGRQRNVMFVNHHDGTFSDVAGVLGLDWLDDSRAFALSDFDHDGRLEFALKNRTGPQLRMMRNAVEGLGDSVFLRLRGTRSNRDAIGAVVTVRADGLKQTKFISAGSGFASQHTKELCFGLGTGRQMVSVEVQWPSGGTSRFEHVPVNRRVELVEGRAEFAAVPYRTRAARPDTASAIPPTDESTVATWLIAPMAGPDLKLADQHGAMHQLSGYRGRAVLLTFLSAGCKPDRTQAQAFERAKVECASVGLVTLVVASPASAETRDAMVRGLGLSVPVLLADERTFAVWNLQFRYLFDRRRDMPLPTSFLLDKTGDVVRVYQGAVTPQDVLADLAAAPQTAAARLAAALPYAGPYLGNPMTRDDFTYGIVFVEYGYHDEAQAAFERVIAANPRYPSAYFNLGTVLMMKKEYAAAEVALRAAVTQNAQDSDAWNNLGMIAGQQARYDEALAAFRASALADPNHLVAVENMMKIYQYQARPADAQKTLEELLVKAPGNADLHLGLAMSLVGQKQMARGRTELETAIRLRPGFVDAINDLGSVRLIEGDAAGALIEFNRCRVLAPDLDRAALNAARAEQRLGHIAGAREILADFLARHPENTAVRDALVKLGAA